MPSPFDITTATNTVTLDNQRTGVAVFTVKNNLRRRVKAQARLTTQPDTAAKWLTILPADSASTDPANMRDFPIDSTQQIQVRIVVPADAPAASYSLKLTLADELNPDDNFTQSPDMLFSVHDTPKPAPTPMPSWIVPAVLIGAAVLVIAIIAGVVISKRPSGTCVAKLKVPQKVYTQPDNDDSHLLDQMAADSQIVPTSRSADGKWWGFTLFGVDAWAETALFSTTADVSGDCDAPPVACLIAITGNQALSSKPSSDPNYQVINAVPGYQYRPVGKLPDNSWWQVYTQMAWIPTNMLNQTIQSSGDCSKLPVVSG